MRIVSSRGRRPSSEWKTAGQIHATLATAIGLARDVAESATLISIGLNRHTCVVGAPDLAEAQEVVADLEAALALLNSLSTGDEG